MDLDDENGKNLKFYKSIDFGTSHPTAVVFAAQDLDDNIYIYDEIYKSNTLLREIAEEIKKKSGKREFVYTLYDKAAKREATEIAQYGIKAIPADKSSKGENDLSNRRTGIMIVNQMFADKKLFISSNCVNLIKELESHYYKEGGKRDGEVNKVNDDLLDALRYLIFNIKKNNKG